MQKTIIRQSLTLSTEEWKKLKEIAKRTGSFANRGPKTGHSSWRAMLRRIAIGELVVVEAEHNKNVTEVNV